MTEKHINLNATKHDQQKTRYELLPVEALEGEAKVLTFGAIKYGDNNWRKGMAWSRAFGATLRHLWAFWRGEDYDAETGLLHLYHARCEIGFLCTYFETNSGEDDRP